MFGIGPWHFYTYEKPFVKEMTYKGEDTDCSVRIALSYFGPMRIELIEVKEGDSVYEDFIKEHGDDSCRFFLKSLSEKYAPSTLWTVEFFAPAQNALFHFLGLVNTSASGETVMFEYGP